MRIDEKMSYYPIILLIDVESIKFEGLEQKNSLEIYLSDVKCIFYWMQLARDVLAVGKLCTKELYFKDGSRFVGKIEIRRLSL